MTHGKHSFDSTGPSFFAGPCISDESSTSDAAWPADEPGDNASNEVTSNIATETAGVLAGIEMTQAALEAVRAALVKRGTPRAALRLGVKPGGCNGFSYLIAYEDAPAKPHDRVYEFEEVRVYVDKKSLVFLAGSVLDYEKSLMKQGFRFRNPNEAAACGCGTSFSVK